jgi:hypothetical protein
MIGKWVRRLILIAAAAAALIWLIGSFASRHYRSIRLTALVPEGAELGNGTAIAVNRDRVGTVAKLGPLRNAVPLQLGSAERPGAARSIVLEAGDSATSNAGGATLVARLDSNATHLSLSVENGAAVALGLEPDSSWSFKVPRGSKLMVNGKTVAADSTLHLAESDRLVLSGAEVRVGQLARFRPAELSFMTRKLCADSTSGFFPNAREQQRCRAWKLGPAAQLELESLFGLTKPVLKLKPSENQVSTLAAGNDRVQLVVPRDLLSDVRQILAYLNATPAERPEPRTHFEMTLAHVDQVVADVHSTTGEVKRTLEPIKLALREHKGLASLVFNDSTARHVDSIIARVTRITEPLADTGKTGVRQIVRHADLMVDSVKAMVGQMRDHVDRLAPRIELAVEGAAKTIEGAEGTLTALKGAAEDIQNINQNLKKGVKASKPYMVGGGIGLGLTALLASIASVIFIIP